MFNFRALKKASWKIGDKYGKHLIYFYFKILGDSFDLIQKENPITTVLFMLSTILFLIQVGRMFEIKKYF